MNIGEFQQSLHQPHPPAGLSLCLLALWWAGKGEWEQAHLIAQDVSSREGCWVHAYLHRVEGDAANAAYWYKQAGVALQIPRSQTLDEEWASISTSLLSSQK